MIFRKIQQIKQAQSISAVKPELDNELHFPGPALAVGRSPQVAPELARFITERIKEDNKLSTERRKQKEERQVASTAALVAREGGNKLSGREGSQLQKAKENIIIKQKIVMT